MAARSPRQRLQIGFEDNFEILSVTVTYLEGPQDQADISQESLKWIVLEDGTRAHVKTMKINTGFLLGIIGIGLGVASLALAVVALA